MTINKGKAHMHKWENPNNQGKSRMHMPTTNMAQGHGLYGHANDNKGKARMSI